MGEKICIGGGRLSELDGEAAPYRGMPIECAKILDFLQAAVEGASIACNRLAARRRAARVVV